MLSRHLDNVKGKSAESIPWNLIQNIATLQNTPERKKEIVFRNQLQSPIIATTTQLPTVVVKKLASFFLQLPMAMSTLSFPILFLNLLTYILQGENYIHYFLFMRTTAKFELALSDLMSLMIKLRSTSSSTIQNGFGSEGCGYTNVVIKLTGYLTVRLNVQFMSPFLIED